MATERVKNLIIGSGEGGKFLAWHLAGQGESTAVIERRWIGGSCPNTNCLPSKNEIWSAKVAQLAAHGKEFGVDAGTPRVDLRAVRDRKRRMVDALVKIHVDRYRATGVNLVMGSATFTGPRTVRVALNDGGTREIEGERIFLNLGTHAAIPDSPGLRDARPMTHIEMLELDVLPEHLVVVGGGYVGLEFAQAYRRFGSRVTIVQHNAQLLVAADADVVAEVMRLLIAEGIDVITSAEITRVTGTSGDRVTMSVKAPTGERQWEGTHILVAAGRTPTTAGIGLDIAGVALDAHGYIAVDDRLRTSAKDIWAIGECAGSPQFTHASYDDFRVIRDNLAGKAKSTKDRLMPSCLFIDPQVAHVGLTEAEAAKQGVAVRVKKIPTAAVLRTRTMDETAGFVKVLIDAKSDRILGFTMIAPEAGEVMAVVQTAMLAGLPYTALGDAIFAHPTMAEGLTVLFAGHV